MCVLRGRDHTSGNDKRDSVNGMTVALMELLPVEMYIILNLLRQQVNMEVCINNKWRQQQMKMAAGKKTGRCVVKM